MFGHSGGQVNFLSKHRVVFVSESALSGLPPPPPPPTKGGCIVATGEVAWDDAIKQVKLYMMMAAAYLALPTGQWSFG